MVLYRPDGKHMTADDWQDPSARALAMALDGRQIEDSDGETTERPVPVAPQRPLRAGRVRRCRPAGPNGTPCSPPGPSSKTPKLTRRRTIALDARSLLLLHSA